jgi:hypothetical protein
MIQVFFGHYAVQNVSQYPIFPKYGTPLNISNYLPHDTALSHPKTIFASTDVKTSHLTYKNTHKNI